MRAARRALATRTCQFMGIYLRAYLCTREYAWLLVRVCLLAEKLNTLIYARERACERVSRIRGTFSSVGLEHMEGFVAPLIASQIMNFQVFFVSNLPLSLFSWQKGKKKRIFYEWWNEIGYRRKRRIDRDHSINTVRWEEVIASGKSLSRKILDFNRAWCNYRRSNKYTIIYGVYIERHEEKWGFKSCARPFDN